MAVTAAILPVTFRVDHTMNVTAASPGEQEMSSRISSLYSAPARTDARRATCSGLAVPLRPAVDRSLEIGFGTGDSGTGRRGAKAGSSAARAPSMEFVRKTTKYWMRSRDVDLAKRLVGAELPLQSFPGTAPVRV